MNKAVFFDRDGVINELIFRDGGYYSPRTLDSFKLCSGVIEATQKTHAYGYLNIVVSNQPDIARGKIDINILNQMTDLMKNQLIIDDVFYCLHRDLDNCNCRKPKPGLIIEAKNKWNIDLGNSLMIGDSLKDYGAAKSVNVKFFLLNHLSNQHLDVKNRIKSISEIDTYLK